MPLQRLCVPANNNHFYSAFSLGLLLSVFEDEVKLSAAIKGLFGKVTVKESAKLIAQLEAYSQETYPAVLEQFINAKLRLRVVQYINEACETPENDLYRSFDPAFLLAATKAIEQGSPLFDSVARIALEQMTDVHVQMDSLLSCTAPAEESAHTLNHTIVHLTLINNVYQYSVDPDCLPDEIRKNVFPFIGCTQINDMSIYRRAKLKDVVLKALSPNNFSKISTLTSVPPKGLYNPYGRRPTNFVDYMRSNALRELQVVRYDMNHVRLTTPYELCLNTETTTDYLKYRLYINIDTTGFWYVGKSAERNDEMIPKTFISFDKLTRPLIAPVTLEQLKSHLPDILEITNANGHTQIQNADILNSLTLTYDAGKSVLTSGITGSIAVTAVTVFEEIMVGHGAAMAILPGVGLGAGIAVFALTMLAAMHGKGYAICYEQALDQASQQVNRGEYAEAAKTLDNEFQRLVINRTTRWFFLSQQHYAMAHFLRAVSADITGDTCTAYIHYEESCKNAKSAEKQLSALVTELQIIRLLKNPEVQLPAKITDRNIEIKERLARLSNDYEPAFTESYWALYNNMDNIAQQLIKLEPLKNDEISLINSFLMSDGFFTLKYYSKGAGQYLGVFGAFFQALVLAFFDLTNSAYLNEDIKAKLIIELSPENKHAEKINLIVLASKKFAQCASRLRDFKHDHPELIENNSVIQNSIRIIESYILNFYVLSVDNKIITMEDCYNIATLLNVERPRVEILSTNINSSIHFMMELNHDFGVSFETLDQWLDEIINRPGSMANLLSISGDTMLHALTKLPIGETDEITRRIRDAATKLKDLRHKPNKNSKTPLQILQVNDPCQLKKQLLPGAQITTCALVAIEDSLAIQDVLRNIPFEAAYVRLINDNESGIFYVSSRNIIEWTKLEKSLLDKFDLAMKPVGQAQTLTDDKLDIIERLAKHSHRYIEWNAYIEFDRQRLEEQIQLNEITSLTSENQAMALEKNAMIPEPESLDTSNEQDLKTTEPLIKEEPVNVQPSQKKSKSLGARMQKGMTLITGSIRQTFHGSSTAQTPPDKLGETEESSVNLLSNASKGRR